MESGDRKLEFTSKSVQETLFELKLGMIVSTSGHILQIKEDIVQRLAENKQLMQPLFSQGRQ